MVAGKDLSPYLVPYKIKLSCDMSFGQNPCAACPVGIKNGELIREFDYESNTLIRMLQVTDSVLRNVFKEEIGIPRRCGVCEIETMEAINVEEVRLIPEIDWSTTAAPYVVRTGYVIGHGIPTNRPYIMRGKTLPDPRNQYATHLIEEAVPALDTIDTFEVTRDVAAELKLFQPQEPGLKGLRSKLDDIYNDYEANVTQIYQRRDLMLAYDLIFHSVLHFRFQDTLIKKGWLECLVLGDTRCGKTKAIERMIEHYRAGEIATGENASIAGLVGGLQQVNNRWSIQWGKLPLNDRRLLVIDEASGLPQEDISRLSGVRDTGIAEIVKIQTERTHARTRMIWISNPRANRSLRTYDHGVNAIRELIGRPEDIARFDFMVTAASGEVPLEDINRPKVQKVHPKYVSDLCHELVLWAWSRMEGDVIFTPEAIEITLEIAQRQGEKYHSSIPLIEAAEHRITLARIAAAAAARFFSTEDGSTLVVCPEHVELAEWYLDYVYGKPSLKYNEYSIQKKAQETIKNPAQLITLIDDDLAQFLLENERLLVGDFEAFLGERSKAKEIITALVRQRAIRRIGSSYYVKTPAFIEWLRNRMGDFDAPF